MPPVGGSAGQGAQGWAMESLSLVSPEVDRPVGSCIPLASLDTNYPYAQEILFLSLHSPKLSPVRWGSPGLALRSPKPGLKVCGSGSLKLPGPGPVAQ